MVTLVWEERERQPVRHLIARDQARHDLRPCRPLAIGHRECGRDHGGARMAATHLVGVLEVEQIGEPGVGEGGSAGGHARRNAEGHRLWLAPRLLDVGEDRTGFVETPSADHHPDRIEKGESGPFADGRRQLVRPD